MDGTSLERKGLSYQTCRYGTSKILFRGPAAKFDDDYIAFLGGSETFGRFIPTPYPALIEKKNLGVSCVNLGCIDAGLDSYVASPELLEICSNARLTVIEILGATNMSNRFYSVDQRHNDRFLRASRKMKDLYPEVDFSPFTHIHEMLVSLSKTDDTRLHQLRQEIQTAWVARMRSLLQKISGPKLLLWVADHQPFTTGSGGTICRAPLFIDRAMLRAVEPQADGLVEVIATPQDIQAGRKDMIFNAADDTTSRDILGPKVHDHIVASLTPELRDILQKKNPGTIDLTADAQTPS